MAKPVAKEVPNASPESSAGHLLQRLFGQLAALALAQAVQRNFAAFHLRKKLTDGEDLLLGQLGALFLHAEDDKK